MDMNLVYEYDIKDENIFKILYFVLFYSKTNVKKLHAKVIFRVKYVADFYIVCYNYIKQYDDRGQTIVCREGRFFKHDMWMGRSLLFCHTDNVIFDALIC